MSIVQTVKGKVHVEVIKKLSATDSSALAEVAASAMTDTYGFNIGHKKWKPPMIRDLEQYFAGAMLIPKRTLIVGRIEKNIVGSLQMLFPHKVNDAANFSVNIYDFFVAYSYRNSGVAMAMLKFAETYARLGGYKLLKMSIKTDLVAAVTLVEKLGYTKWGVLGKYELSGDEIVSGNFYCKDI
jgi:GNAT superfamily N-acetyltransferase